MFDNQATQFFYELTPDRILVAVEELGTRCTGKIIPLNSVENRVYDVELEIPYESLESKYQASRVIKIYRPGRWSKEQILEEHQFIKDLEERDLPVVPPLNFPDGQTVHTVAGLDQDLFFSIFPKIGGRILDEYTDSQIAMLGRFIARMHQVGRSEKAKHRNVLTPKSYGIDNCKYLVEKQILPLEVQARYLQLVEQICEVSNPWFESVPLQRLHGDCHLGNILWLDEGCTFVDFDDFIMGPPIQDLWLIVPGRDQWSVKQRELLMESYSEMIDFDFESVRLIEPLRALRMVNFSTWIAKRWDDPAFKNIFPLFGTPQYWREELNALEEVLQIMHCGEVF